MKIVGNTVGMGLPKPNLMQTDPKKGDYVKGKEKFLEQIPGGGGSISAIGQGDAIIIETSLLVKGQGDAIIIGGV